jgi:hypothetical protein
MADESKQPPPATPPGTLDVEVPVDSPTSFSAMGALPVEAVTAPPPPPPPPATERPSPSATPAMPAPGAGADADADAAPPAQPWLSSRFVRTGIFAAFAVAVVTIALLFSRWFHTDDASALIVVGLSADYDGAVVVVSGPRLRDNLSGTLSASENMVLRFHVPSGRDGVYDVTVTKPGRPTKFTQSDPNRPLGPSTIWWPFDAPASVTSPSTRPGKP